MANAAFLVMALVFGAPGLARAQAEHRVSLIYVMDPGLYGCPSRAEFQGSVSRQLGYDPFRDEAPRQVIVRSELTATGLRGQLTWRDANGSLRGERQLLARRPDCRELARSMAFAIVVQLQLLDAAADGDPAARSESAPSVPPRQPEGASVLGEVVDSEPPGAAEAGDWGPRSLRLGVGTSVASGLGPGATLLGRVFGAVAFDALSLELGVAASWPTTERSADGSGFRSAVQLATFAPCVNVDWFSGCAVAHFGRLRVSGLSLDEPRAPSGMISQAGVRLAASQSLGPVSASLRLEGLRSFHQWTVEVNRSPVWEVPSTSFVLGLDVALPIALGD